MPATVTRVDISGAMAKLRRLESNRALAGQRGVSVLATAATGDMVVQAAISARDTQRYMRGWTISHNDAAGMTLGEVGPKVLPAVLPGKYAEKIRPRLVGQYQKWKAIEENLLRLKAADERRGKGKEQDWPSYRRLMKTLDKIGDIVDRTIEQIEAYDKAVVEGTTGTAVVIGGRRTKRPGISNVSRISFKLYGGSARVFTQAGRTFVEIKNMEPHARIIERRLGIGRSSIAKVRTIGLFRASNAYLKSLKSGTST